MLNHVYSYRLDTTVSGPFGPQPTSLHICKVGHKVTMKLPATWGTAISMGLIVFAAPIPEMFRPPLNMHNTIIVSIGGAYTMGQLIVEADGDLKISASLDYPLSIFPSGGAPNSTGFPTQTISYSIA
jgi:hypothetical protein